MLEKAFSRTKAEKSLIFRIFSVRELCSIIEVQHHLFSKGMCNLWLAFVVASKFCFPESPALFLPLRRQSRSITHLLQSSSQLLNAPKSHHLVVVSKWERFKHKLASREVSLCLTPTFEGGKLNRMVNWQKKKN